jgi:hypothetical protein
VGATAVTWRRCAGAGIVGIAVAAALVEVVASVAATQTGPCGAAGKLTGAASLTCTYDRIGSDVFTVPARVTRADFTVTGAMGGHYFIAADAAHPTGAITGRAGGAGGQVSATLTLTPGDVLQVDIAGAGANGTAASRSGGMMNGPYGGQGAAGGVGGSGDAGGGAGGDAPADGGNGSGGGGASDVRGVAGGCAAMSCPLGARLLVGAGGGGGGGTGGQGNAIGGAGGAGGGASGADASATIDGGNKGAFGHGGTAA